MNTRRNFTPSDAMEAMYRHIDTVRYVGRTIHHDPEAAELASTVLIASAERMEELVSSVEDALSAQMPGALRITLDTPQYGEVRI